MPETACLHIQARDTDPIRVVELPGTSVRIGRASFCEVRLAEPDIADEECRLRRKGGQWQLVPSRSAGFVWIDGRSVEEPCSLPFDVPFRVGEHWLTLRPNGSAPAWRDYQAPVPTASAALLGDLRAERSRGRDRDEPGDVPHPSAPRTPTAGDQDHLSRWKERHEERTSRTRLGQEQRRWEERWRAAGERLRARPTTAVPPRTVEPPASAAYRSGSLGSTDFRESIHQARPTPVAPRVPFASDLPPAASLVFPAAPPLPPGTGVALPDFPAHEPFRLDPPVPQDRKAPEPAEPELAPTSAPDLDTPASVPYDGELETDEVSEALPLFLPAAPTQESSPAEPGALEGEPTVEPERHVAAFSPEPAPPEEPSAIPPPVLDSQAILPAREEAPSEVTAGEPAAVLAPEPCPAAVVEEPREDRAAPTGAVPPPPAPAPAPATLPVEEARRGGSHAPFVTDTHAARGPDPAASPPPPPSKPDFTTVVHDAGVSQLRPAPPPRRPARPAAPQPAPGPRPEARKSSSAREGGSERGPDGRGGASPRPEPSAPEASREWPTVRDILDAHRAQAARPAAPRPSPRPSSREPIPTQPAEPPCWSLPLWLGWLPSVALALAVGSLGLVLAWTWAVDARRAGAVARLMGPGTSDVKPLPPAVVPPDASWWKSTASNLMVWALYFDRRSTVEPETADRALELLETAAQASPIHPQVRFALARRPASADDAPALVPSLGLSRDVVALSWSAHQWLRAGKKPAALKAYRAALEMASRAELARLSAPAFDDDPQIKRYRLPGEDLIGTVVRDMVEHEGWSFAEWSEALPSFAPVPLAAARLLRERGNPDSEKALDSIVSRLDAPTPDGCPASLHVAAQAEALALKGQWAPAEARYREAIALMPNDTIRRAWWMNLADIAGKLNDEPGRQKALEAAKGNDANDEIALRAIEILKYSIVRVEKTRSPR